jgi:hypothetical protein
MGYVVTLVEGALPAGLTLPQGAVRSMGGMIYLHWVDGDSDDQEALAFTVMVAAVDLAGNTGPGTTISIRDAGSGGGCSLIATRTLSAWPVATFGLILLARLGRRVRWRRVAGKVLPSGRC